MKNKKLIIIIEIAHIRKYLNRIDKDTTVIGWNQEVCEELERRRIKYKTINFKYNEEIGIKWIKTLARKNILDNKNLISFFEFNGTSLWWWMEHWLYVSHAYYDSFNEIIKVFCIIYDIIKKENPNEIIFVKEDMLHDKTIRLIAEKYGIKTKTIHSYFKLIQFRITKKLKIILIKYRFVARFLIRKVLFSFLLGMRKKSKKLEKNKYILAKIECNPSPDYTLPVLEILKKINTNIYALDVVGEPGFLSVQAFIKKVKDTELNHILLEDFISKGDIKYINRVNIEQISKWESLKKDKKFKQFFELKGINLWNIIEPQFSCYFNVRLKDHLIHLIGIDNVIESIRPKIAITPAETTEFDKGLFLACQKRKIPVVASQHGLFYGLRCIHEKDEVSLKEIKPKYCPIPTITTVYGEIDREFLVKKGNYPKNSVIVTGHTRYDRLAKANEIFNKRQICKELKLDPDKKIIVLVTGPFDLVKDREILITTVCEAIREIKNLQLIVKVHPYEKIKFYEKRIKESKANVLVTKYDIFKIVFISDAVINVSSTAGLEAAILNKPLISPNYISDSSLSDSDFVQKGVAIGVNNPRELAKTIKEILYQKKISNDLKKNREKYVYEHCYKIDGKASYRIANLIEKMIST